MKIIVETKPPSYREVTTASRKTSDNSVSVNTYNSQSFITASHSTLNHLNMIQKRYYYSTSKYHHHHRRYVIIVIILLTYFYLAEGVKELSFHGQEYVLSLSLSLTYATFIEASWEIRPEFGRFHRLKQRKGIVSYRIVHQVDPFKAFFKRLFVSIRPTTPESQS
ncbi:hypothetical protein DFA_02849 [Cavenderia fasciculata]|uniref:Transmembrane protein n=1 Tax=Cavenderia fasciculata TaxID=261658 RepID=F4PIM6_CACFS|nr:uncharacterized protein DFA_02849 [Cavenderia fasciculata]EGG24606.1 hypothetical protein DFA_02849 [Cavenderia fasciculata]|eukprot:XP_004362457.1 hypothetical protein DFA_02849 [Cavenderia fasciculata]